MWLVLGSDREAPLFALRKVYHFPAGLGTGIFGLTVAQERGHPVWASGARAASRKNGHEDNFYCFRCLEIRRLGVSEAIIKILQAS